LTSTSGDNEKTAVITSDAVITSGHRYREIRRSLSVCTTLVAERFFSVASFVD
jgi:hypothetical protein